MILESGQLSHGSTDPCLDQLTPVLVTCPHEVWIDCTLYVTNLKVDLL